MTSRAFRTFLPVSLSILLLSGCAGTPQVDEAHSSAQANCLNMANEAMPNGMLDPDDETHVLEAAEFCERIESGMNAESFKKAYNDPEFLASELEIWSKYNYQP